MSAVSVVPLFMTGALSVEIADELGASRTWLGAGFAAPFAVGAVFASAISRIVDRYGPRRAGRAAGVVTAASLFILGALVAGPLSLVVVMGISGIGTTMAQIAANVALARADALGPNATAFAAKEAAVPLAAVGAGLSVPLLAQPFGWRTSFLLAGVAVVFWVARMPQIAVAGETRAGGGAEGWQPDAAMVALGLVGLFTGAISNSISTFAVDFSVTQGAGHATAAVLLMVGSGGTFAARLGSGIIVDRYGISPVRLGQLFAAAAMVSMVALSIGSPEFAILWLPVVMLLSWGWPNLLYYAAAERFSAAASRATAFVLAFVFVGTVAGPIAIGAIADHFGYSVAWAIGAASLAVAVVAGFRAAHTP